MSADFPLARAPISLRDAIVAAARLAPSEADTDDILELLGLPPIQRRSRAETPGPMPGPAPLESEPRPRPEPRPAPPSKPPDAHRLHRPIAAQPARVVEAARVAPAAWLPADGRRALKPAHCAGNPTAVPPLFAPLEAPALFTAALSTWARTGPLDIPHAVATLARGRLLDGLPRQLESSTRGGALLLLDRGPQMAPFRTDLDALERVVRSLLGGLLEVAHFYYCPSRGVRATGQSSLSSFRPPPRGAAVLIASDFGASGTSRDRERASVATWVRFAGAVRAEGHNLVGLTPFGGRRWPRRLRPLVRFVHWSEATSARVVLHTLEGGCR